MRLEIFWGWVSKWKLHTIRMDERGLSSHFLSEVTENEMPELRSPGDRQILRILRGGDAENGTGDRQ